MTRHFATLTLAMIALSSAALAQKPAYTDPEKTDADFAYQGEYVGSIKTDDGEQKLGAQIVALGGGKFRAVAYHGGLPGDGWNGDERREAEGELKDGTAVFEGDEATGRIKDGVAAITTRDGRDLGRLDKVHRSSPTLGAKPPEGAVVLFDGKSADAFQGGKMTEDGLLMAGCTSKQRFGDCRVHVEFRLPYQPHDRDQARGNSGIYLAGRYEVQMLDSFGSEGKHNECGGIYSVRDPDLNMCLPPLAWQTYDIDYTAAKYDGDKLVANPRITVKHNGVVIHNDIELPGNRNTTAAPLGPGPEPGPVYLQDHGNPVRYRNIWVVEK
jgi:hypothetical protein